MPEQIPQGAERALDPLVALHNTAQSCFADPYDPAVLDRQRELLSVIIGEAAGRQTDPVARQVIESYGQVIDYFWFQPADAPLASEVVFTRVDGEKGERWGELVIGKEAVAAEIMIGFRESQKQPVSLVHRLEQSVSDLLEELGRFMDLPEAVPPEVVIERLATWRKHDPIVWTLGSLYRAIDELRAEPGDLSPQILRELAQALDHLQALSDLSGRRDPADPEGYATQPHLLEVLTRSLQPVEVFTRPYRSFPTETKD